MFSWKAMSLPITFQSHYEMYNSANYYLRPLASGLKQTGMLHHKLWGRVGREWRLILFGRSSVTARLFLLHLAAWARARGGGGVRKAGNSWGGGVWGLGGLRHRVSRRRRRREGGLLATCGLHKRGTNHRGTWQSEWQMNNASIFQPPCEQAHPSWEGRLIQFISFLSPWAP